MTMLVYCLTLFKRLKANNVLVIKEKQVSIDYAWAHDMCSSFAPDDSSVQLHWHFVSGL